MSPRRSKMEMYADVLKTLAQKGPQKLTHLMYKANVNCSVLKEYLDLLIKAGFVEEQHVGGKRVVYDITGKGREAFDSYCEARKRFFDVLLGEEKSGIDRSI